MIILMNTVYKKTTINTGWKLVKKTVEATKFSERTVNQVLLEKGNLVKLSLHHYKSVITNIC